MDSDLTPAHNLVAVSWVGTRAASCPVPLAFTQALAEPSSLCSPLWDRRLQLWLVLPRVVAGQHTYLWGPEPRLVPAMALVKAVSCRLCACRAREAPQQRSPASLVFLSSVVLASSQYPYGSQSQASPWGLARDVLV